MIICHKSSLMPDGFELNSDFDVFPPIRTLYRLFDRECCEVVFDDSAPIMKGGQVLEKFNEQRGPIPGNMVPISEEEL